MSTVAPHGRHIAMAFPGPVARLSLRLLAPAERREEFTGDLIEEAESRILPRHGRRAALSWFWWQIVASAPPVLARRWTRGISMNPQRWIVAAVILVMCTLMAMDSGLLSVTPRIAALVTLAIAIPAAAGLLSGSLGVYGIAAAVSALLLIAARILSTAEFRWYAMGFMAFVVLALGWAYEHRGRPPAPRGTGPGAPA